MGKPGSPVEAGERQHESDSKRPSLRRNVAQIVAQQLIACHGSRPCPCQLPSLEHDALVGESQRAMHVLLDQDHGHPRFPGAHKTVQDQLDNLRSQPEGRSSAIMSLGDVTKARANESICCSPPGKKVSRLTPPIGELREDL